MSSVCVVNQPCLQSTQDTLSSSHKALSATLQLSLFFYSNMVLTAVKKKKYNILYKYWQINAFSFLKDVYFTQAVIQSLSWEKNSPQCSQSAAQKPFFFLSLATEASFQPSSEEEEVYRGSRVQDFGGRRQRQRLVSAQVPLVLLSAAGTF